MKKLLSKKNIFFLSVAISFLYSGFCFFTVKEFNAQFVSLIDGYGALFIAMTVIFMLLVILSGLKLNELRKTIESNPMKMYDMMFHIVYMTFLYATMYLLLNGAVMIAIPPAISSVLLLKTWIINLPLALIYLAVKIKKCNKKNLFKSLLIHLIIVAVMITELAVADIIIFGLMFSTGKINTSKNITKTFDILALVALLVTVTILLIFLADGAWLLAASAGVLILVVFSMQLPSIKLYLNIIKNKIGGIKYET